MWSGYYAYPWIDVFGFHQEPIDYCLSGLSSILFVFNWQLEKQCAPFQCYYILKELIREFVFQDGVRFYIYFDSDYELDADSVEEKNKVRPNLVFDWNTLTLLPYQCIYEIWYAIWATCM